MLLLLIYTPADTCHAAAMLTPYAIRYAMPRLYATLAAMLSLRLFFAIRHYYVFDTPAYFAATLTRVRFSLIDAFSLRYCHAAFRFSCP